MKEENRNTLSYKLTQEVIARLHEPVLVLDKRFHIVNSNPEFHKKFKVTPEEIEGKLLFEICEQQWNIQRLKRLLKEAIVAKKNLKKVEISHEFPAGRRTLLLNSYSIEQKELKDRLIFLAISDITELVAKRKEIDKIHRAYREELRNKNRSLKEKNKELEKIKKELKSFSFMSNHDLQEPLRKIRNFADCLLREEQKNLSGAGKDYLLRMQETSNRMQTFIDDLLSYSRMEKEKIVFKEAYPWEISKKVMEEFGKKLYKRNASLTYSPVKTGKIRIIPCQLEQLFRNLLNNSVKFSDSKKPLQIHLKFKKARGSSLNNFKLSPEKNYYHISFSDNGIGFDPQYKEKIFEVFQRLHPYDLYKGSGVGLAICKKIVENHNGVITAKGEVNKGACFDIYFPAEES